jgi:transposase-like protein
MTTQAKQKYTAEFKGSAVKRANESSNVTKTACELGIKENTLYNWVYQYSRPPKGQVLGSIPIIDSSF